MDLQSNHPQTILYQTNIVTTDMWSNKKLKTQIETNNNKKDSNYTTTMLIRLQISIVVLRPKYTDQ